MHAAVPGPLAVLHARLTCIGARVGPPGPPGPPGPYVLSRLWIGLHSFRLQGLPLVSQVEGNMGASHSTVSRGTGSRLKVLHT